MRRILFFLLWFVLLSVTALIASGVIVSLGDCPETEEFSVGYECGKAITEQFMAKWRLPILAGTFLACLAGALTGLLPGTKKR